MRNLATKDDLGRALEVTTIRLDAMTARLTVRFGLMTLGFCVALYVVARMH